MGVKLYKILTLEQAEEYKDTLFKMGEGEYSTTIVADRTQYLWLVRRMYDAGMVVGVEEIHEEG